MLKFESGRSPLRMRVVDEYLPAGLAAALWTFSALTLPMGVELIFLASVLIGSAIIFSAILRCGHKRTKFDAAVADAVFGGLITAFGLMALYQGGSTSALPNLVLITLLLITAAWRIRISTTAEES